jgi:hypothetical protein
MICGTIPDLASVNLLLVERNRDSMNDDELMVAIAGGDDVPLRGLLARLGGAFGGIGPMAYLLLTEGALAHGLTSFALRSSRWRGGCCVHRKSTSR